ncbi:MAG TPA: PAC2 family protein, partial [Candidatus Lustribacter sp.]|nr:PAC2 family protein [Candidatus Lustribacter sp.]
MSDPQPLFRFDPSTSPDQAQAAVLVVSMGGFIDAGHTQRLVTEALLESHRHRPVATVDLDPLYDYRGRRPVMTFDRDRWTQYDKPALTLD